MKHLYATFIIETATTVSYRKNKLLQGEKEYEFQST